MKLDMNIILTVYLSKNLVKIYINNCFLVFTLINTSAYVVTINFETLCKLRQASQNLKYVSQVTLQ